MGEKTPPLQRASTKDSSLKQFDLLNPYKYKAVTSHYISCESRNCFYEVRKLISWVWPGVKCSHYARLVPRSGYGVVRLKSFKGTRLSGPLRSNGANYIARELWLHDGILVTMRHDSLARSCLYLALSRNKGARDLTNNSSPTFRASLSY